MKINQEDVTTLEKTDALTNFQLEALEKAENELNDLRNELETKKYLIDLKKEDINLLNSFNTNDAPWKFTECLGVVELEKELNASVKSGKLYISAMPIEAIYYYLSKVEGKGNTTNTTTFTDVKDYIRVLKAVTNGIERVKADTERLRQAEFVVASRREGIDPEVTSESEN
jgi:hypothetical protein